eukprot:1343377-Rhodomonas_salina.2
MSAPATSRPFCDTFRNISPVTLSYRTVPNVSTVTPRTLVPPLPALRYGRTMSVLPRAWCRASRREREGT